MEIETKQRLAYTRTFGCRANVSDGEKINGMLAEMGYGFTKNQNEADLILFNTCAVRENAETRVFGNVGALIHQKRKNPDLIVAVCGCMVQQEHAAEKLYDTFPFVDLIFGTHVLHKLPELLSEVITKKSRVTDISSTETIEENLPIKRESEFKADVPIMYGCNNFCSYCVVPYVRGRERSRKSETVLNEIRGLVSDGVKEVLLLGQNVNSYNSNDVSFIELLKEIDIISGDFHVSYMTSHPKDLTNELIDFIAESSKVSHHLHLPVQAGSNRVLEKMNRGYTVEQYMNTIDYARKRIPSISITTDIIVGFPGEAREDFEETLGLIKKAKFDSAYTFIYSKREGTKAANMEDPVSKEEKGKWFTEMLSVLEEVSGSAYERYVGKTLQVLCEGEGRTGEHTHSGKSREGIIVDFDGETHDIGRFINIKVNKALKWAVIGEKDNG
jgi:tRNA-2-methylthio-N6-dimethylallyladenosine synthase